MDHQPSQLPAHTLRSLTRSMNDLGKAMATPFAATAASVNLAAQRLAHALDTHSPASQVYALRSKRLYTCCGQQRIEAAADCVEVECPDRYALPAPYLLYGQCPDCGCMCLTLPVPAAAPAYIMLDTGHHDRRLARRLREDPEFRAEFERQRREIASAGGYVGSGATKPRLTLPSYRKPRTAPRVPTHVPDHRSQS